jgi:hypothetical protein
MALTPVEEGQIRDILQNYNGIQDLSQASSEILAALGYGDVMVTSLPQATALAADDVFYLAKTGSDVKASIQQLADFVATIFNGAVTSVNGQAGTVVLKTVNGETLTGPGNITIATSIFSNATALAQAQAIANSF